VSVALQRAYDTSESADARVAEVTFFASIASVVDLFVFDFLLVVGRSRL
jgi:hypothetical protein